MSDPELVDFARRRIESYRRQRASDEASLARINQGMTFHEAYANSPMRDVTEERKADLMRHIELMGDCIAVWEREIAKAGQGDG